MLKQQLQIKLSQKLSPQQIQLMKMIQLSTLELEQKIETEIGENPALENGKEELAKMDNWNVKHHTENGLLDRIQSDGVSMENAERQTLEFLKEHCSPGQSPLCGNTIGQDRRFLRRYMPELHDFFHYRSVDVTSIKILARSWYPEVGKWRKNSGHRALDDIRGSIEELSYYRDKLFRD